MCVLRCSFMRSLTLVHLHGVEVDLPALASISHQLHDVSLYKCLLLSSCWPAAGTNVFASGWDDLEELSLEKSSMDTHILAANMPSLHHLMLKGFSIKNASDHVLYGIMDAFAVGCSRATYVEFEPLAWRPLAFCNKLAALERLQLALHPCSSRHHVEPMWNVDNQMPSSLTVLECMSSAKVAVDSPALAPGECVSLRVALSAAAACIRAGVPLQSLKLAHCTPVQWVYEGDDSDDEDGMHLIVPDEGQAVQLYRPVATALHGLVRLDLLHSLACGEAEGEAAVNELVLSAPSLTSLMLRIDRPAGAHARLVCAGLEELHVKHNLWPRPEKAAVHFNLFLEGTAALRSCTLEAEDHCSDLRQGDSKSVVLSCHESAGIEASVRYGCGTWLLGLQVRVPSNAQGSGQRQATVSYVFYGDEGGWGCAVE